MTRDLFLRSALACLVLALGVGLVAGLAVLAAGEFSGSFAGWQFALAAHPKIAVVAAALAGALCVFLVVALFVRPPKAGSSPSAVATWFSPSVALLASFCILWLMFVGLVAAFGWRPELIPMSLSILLLGAALGVARRTAGLLASPENKLEVRHDIVGIGGGLGAWRISPAAAGAVFSLLLLAGALALATSGLPHSPQKTAGGGTEDTGKGQEKPPAAPVKPGAKE